MLLKMHHRRHLGGATSILDADADDAGEEDDGNKTTQKKPDRKGFRHLVGIFSYVAVG